jgi:flavin-dependent dehydrogenase
VVSPSRGGELRTLYAPLVVAADGRRSVVVRHTGTVRRYGPAVVGVKRHLRLADRSFVAPGQLEMHSFAGGYLGLCRVADEALNVCGIVPRRVLRSYRGSIDGALQRLLPADSTAARLLAIGEPLTPWLSVPDVSRQWSYPHSAGVLYVGDALGTIEPLTGQGMSMALLSGQWAAERILEREKGLADADFQRRYARQCRQAFGSVIRWGTALGWLLRHPRLLTGAIVAARGPATWQSRVLNAAVQVTRIAVPTGSQR